MMDDLNRKARGQSLQGLMGAMDEDMTGRIPAFKKGPAPEEEPKPILTIEISAGGAPEIEPDGDDMDLGGDEGSGDPFEEMLRRKQAERG